MVTASISALGDLAASHGRPVEGALLKSVAPLVGYSAERGWQWLGREVRRIVESIHRVVQRAQAEGIAEELCDVTDLIAESIPMIGTTSSEQKRRLLEEILLNAARRTTVEEAHVEAEYALQMIDQMIPEAAVVFPVLAREILAAEGGAIDRWRQHFELPHFIVTRALSDLGLPASHEAFRIAGDESDVSLLAHPDFRAGSDLKGMDRSKVILTVEGAWLAGWILSNQSPAADSPAESTAPEACSTGNSAIRDEDLSRATGSDKGLG